LSMKGKDVTVFTSLSADEANKLLDDRQKSYEKTEDGYRCRTCGERIMQTTLYISIHIKEFKTCAGPGRVLTVNFPYCPNCEGEPRTARACVHVPQAEWGCSNDYDDR